MQNRIFDLHVNFCSNFVRQSWRTKWTPWRSSFAEKHFYVSIYTSIIYLCIYLSVCLSYLFFFYRSFIFLSIYLSVLLSYHVSIHLSALLSIFLSKIFGGIFAKFVRDFFANKLLEKAYEVRDVCSPIVRQVVNIVRIQNGCWLETLVHMQLIVKP